MKKLANTESFLEVDKNVTLKELKTIYRNTMKDTHPDKFINDEAGKQEAEEKANL
jgi:DnaJ-class molecular chaperone